MKASADFNPLASYLAPNSKGTSKSSSMETSRRRALRRSRKTTGDRCLRISSTISRGMRIRWAGNRSTRMSSKCSEEGFRASPTARRYSFVSRTTSKLSFPEFFPGFSNRGNQVNFPMRSFGQRTFLEALTGLLKVFVRFFPGIFFCHSRPPATSIPSLFRTISKSARFNELNPVPPETVRRLLGTPFTWFMLNTPEALL